MKLQAYNPAMVQKYFGAQSTKSFNVASKMDNLDTVVIKELQKELSASMTKNDANNWINNVLAICKKLNIAPKNLPVNEKFKGNLNEIQTKEFASEVFSVIGIG